MPTVTAEAAGSSPVVPAIHSQRVVFIALKPMRVRNGCILAPFCTLFVDLNRFRHKTVTFALRDRDLSIGDAAGVQRIVPGDVKVWIGGGQPVSGPGQSPPAGTETQFRITSAATLPE